MGAAGLILAVVLAYAGLGVLFALLFVAVGVQRIDPAARGAGLVFRALILPGAVILWPLLAVKWVSAARSGDVHRSHP